MAGDIEKSAPLPLKLLAGNSIKDGSSDLCSVFLISRYEAVYHADRLFPDEARISRVIVHMLQLQSFKISL